MPRIAPVTEAEAVDKVAQTYGRIKEMLGTDAVPPLFLAYGRVPAFLQDFYMNFKKFVWSDGSLKADTKATIALAVCSLHRCDPWADFFAKRLREMERDEQFLADVVAVTAACQTYNVFFKFRDISGSDLFSGMAVGLRAHTFTNTSLDEKTVELINVAISDINGCKPCTSGHVAKARDLGWRDDAILEAIQCAATMSGAALFLQAAQPA